MAIDDFSFRHSPRNAAKTVVGVTRASRNSLPINCWGVSLICHRQILHGRSIQIAEKADIVYRGRGDRHSGNGLAIPVEGALKAFSVVGA